MISKSLVEMTKGRWREFIREPSAFIFVLSMPIVWMIVLGLAFSGDNKEQFSVGIFNNSYTSNYQTQNKALNTHEQISIQINSEEAIKTALKLGKVQVAVDWQEDGIQYLYDPTNPQAVHGKQLVNSIIQTSFGRTDPKQSQEILIETPGSRYIDFLIPGLLALSIMTTSFFGTGMMIVLHRRDNLLKRFLTTPMSTFEYFTSHILGRNMMLVMEFAAIFIAGFLLFDFSVMGNILSYFLLSVLGACCFTSFSILMAAQSKDTGAYNGKTNILMLPLMMISGIWFSRASFPEWLVQITDYVPLTALVDGLRKIALEGSSIMDLGFEIGILSIFTLVAIVSAKARFRWY